MILTIKIELPDGHVIELTEEQAAELRATLDRVLGRVFPTVPAPLPYTPWPTNEPWTLPAPPKPMWSTDPLRVWCRVSGQPPQGSYTGPAQ